ncbi:LysR family transcriptional regulator [Alginatibacterium sediminis]|uniref:LysR family transcriptional regulator n=1 Tax=Alginatibacterium sediminis TaxID=2164068 RepID=A0A420EGU6_9ALTE|nr:LysR family transcriptional regulator [Alginatibacterium sediminis]RKF19903.1 LysR family transcriptional regulator [Alginatibacterium sediminis]
MLLEDLVVILKVAEFRSITGAATHLNMRTATASAAVKRVEQSLACELFVRTTRHLRLSPAGERYLPQCAQALQVLEQAKQSMKDEQGILDGELRIALSSDLGRNLVIPWLDQFMQSYPLLKLSANISDSRIDFYRDSVDMALRYGSPSEANVYGFKICKVPRLLCASPSYLESCGAPTQPNELKQHNALLYKLYDLTQDEWQFHKNGAVHKVKLSGNRSSNDGDLVRRWCVAGKGVALKSCLDMSHELLSGEVVPIMTDYWVEPTELWLVCPSRQSITSSVRLLRDEFRHHTQELLSQLVASGIIEQRSVDD